VLSVFDSFSMDKFVIRKSASQSAVDGLVDNLKEFASTLPPKEKKCKGYNSKPWANWDQQQREDAALLYLRKKMDGCKLQYGASCPPRSTLRDWADKYAMQGKVNPMGRPPKLTPEETAAVAKYFSGTRSEGAVIDAEALLVIAKHVLKTAQGSTALDATYFNESWARDFKRRQGWSRRGGDTDRRPSSIADTVEDNKWRRFVQDVFENPAAHGIPMPADHSAIPLDTRLAFEETPLKYFAEQKGTYEFPDVQNVFLSLSREKRMVTGGPVSNASGAIVYFQIIWKGKSNRCHPRFNNRTQHFMHPCIHHDHAVKKTQTHDTFMRFCKDLDCSLLEVKKQASLPLDMPSVLLVDNVSSHLNYDTLVKIESHALRIVDALKKKPAPSAPVTGSSAPDFMKLRKKRLAQARL
jgi:hypothetical protein